MTAASYPTRGNPSPGRPSSSLHFIVGEMSGKLDQIMASILPQLTALQQADASHETRLASLEVWQARTLGGGAVLVFLISSWEIIRLIIHV